MTEYICEPIRDFEWDSGYECGYIRKGELIRCKDCVYYQENFMGRKVCFDTGMVRNSNDFCSRAKRKEDADEKKQAYDLTITCLTGNVDKLTHKLEKFLSDEVGAENWTMCRELIEEEE